METLMESLIEAVRRYPCLWDPLKPDYRDTTIKEAAWQRVVELVNNKYISNVKIAKMEWKRLRDNHRDALKRAKLGKNKLLPAHITTWKYAKAMQFLEPYMKYRITENIETETNNMKQPLNSDQDVSTTEVPTVIDNSTIKRPRIETDTTSHNSCAAQKVQVDALDAFFNCIRQSTREMPLWLQTHVKKKIFAVVIEAEELLASEDKTGNCSQTLCKGDASHSSEMEVTVKNEFLTDEEDECII